MALRFGSAGLFAAAMIAVGGLTSGAAAADKPAALDARAAYYEMRTYYPMPGKYEALNRRFREHTLRIFSKHGMTNVAYWNDVNAPNGRLIYVLAYPSKEAREAAWAAFRADPEWHAVAKASEVDGKLVEKVESVFMAMTDYSPTLNLKPKGR
jgi:hypothetical protein